MVRPSLLIGLLMLAAGSLACSSLSQSPSNSREAAPPSQTVVARYATTTITQAELDSAYAASVGGPANAADSTQESSRAFLDQYLHYRLKIWAARDAGLDTLASIQRDVRQYQQKLARPALLRTEVYEPVVRTLYERRNQAVDVSHILIRTQSNADTTEAYRTIQQIADSLDRGVPFAELALRNSEDPSAQRQGSRGYQGRLGYIRAGQIVQPFEEQMYTTEPGQVSGVFRTQYGYHILKVHDRRPAQPPVELSHILRRAQQDSVQARRFLDSLRTAITSGRLAFATAAQQHSQDPRSASKGGALGEVRPQALPPSLRTAVAQLDTVGSVSGVVRSRFGYHLLKLTGRQEKQSFDEAYPSLKKQVTGQPRVEQRKAAFARTVRADVGTSVDTTRLLTIADITSVDSLARPLLALTDTASAPFSPVASLGDSTYTARQVARHLMQTDGGARMTVGDLLDSFFNEKAIQYAVFRTTRRDPALAQELKKYREGALLFRYMQDSVWTAATRDTAGLRATYRRNQDQYRYPSRVRTIVLRAPADSLLNPYATAYADSRSIRRTLTAAAEDSLVSADTVFVTERSPDVYQPVRSADDLTAIGPKNSRTEWLFMIRDTRLPPRTKRFDEARSSVVQDYQQTYEQKIIRQLRQRYNAETYPERLRPLTEE